MGYEVGKRVKIIGVDNLGDQSHRIGDTESIWYDHTFIVEKTWGITRNGLDNHGIVFPESSLQLLDEPQEKVFTKHHRRIKLPMEV